jgi:hypothetical protein
MPSASSSVCCPESVWKKERADDQIDGALVLAKTERPAWENPLKKAKENKVSD